MLAFIVWHKTVYSVGASACYSKKTGKKLRQRKRWREPRKVLVQQSPEQQAYLSRIEARKWDSESKDYTIYRINVPNETGKRSPTRLALETIDNDCARLGLSGPFFGEGRIGWQGMGDGPEKNVASKLRRQAAQEYLQGKLDLLAQIRVLAGFDSQTEAFTIPDLPVNMRDRWTACLTSELDRWNEYLALSTKKVSQRGKKEILGMKRGKAPIAYNAATEIESTTSQQEGFIRGSEFTQIFGDTDKLNGLRGPDGKINKPTPLVIPGRPMMQSEVDSLEQARDDVSISSLARAGSTDLATFKANYLTIMRAKRSNQQLRSTDCDILASKDALNR